MERYFGLAVAAFFLFYWLAKKFRRPKIANVGTIPTGISNWTYLMVGFSLVLGSIFIYSGAQTLVTEIAHESAWKKSSGIVRAHVPNGTRKSRTLYAPVITFEDANGVAQKAIDRSSTGKPAAVDSTVPLIYDPANPEIARVDDFSSRWLMPLIMIVGSLAAFFFVIRAGKQILMIKSLESLGAPRSMATAVQGTYIETKQNYFLSLRHAKSWRIIAEHKDVAGRLHRYESEPIWEYAPDTWAKADTPVPIMLDRLNPARGWIRAQEYFIACK